MKKALSFLIVSAVVLLAPAVQAFDRSEAEGCRDCHFYPGDVIMTFVVDKWFESEHATAGDGQGFMQNTFCAHCHSPFQADPAATRDDNDPVPFDEWEAITCRSCHMTRDLRIEFETPIGIYHVEEDAFEPVDEEDANDVCIHCHTNALEPGFFQGYGVIMEKKGVQCIACHMPKVLNDYDILTDRFNRSHTMWVRENAVGSCLAAGCHENKDEKWALKQIDKERIHGKKSRHPTLD
jgi:ribosomal protein L40E